MVKLLHRAQRSERTFVALSSVAQKKSWAVMCHRTASDFFIEKVMWHITALSSSRCRNSNTSQQFIKKQLSRCGNSLQQILVRGLRMTIGISETILSCWFNSMFCMWLEGLLQKAVEIVVHGSWMLWILSDVALATHSPTKAWPRGNLNLHALDWRNVRMQTSVVLGSKLSWFFRGWWSTQ